MTRFGDLLDFGHLLKPLAEMNLPKSPKFLGNFCKVLKSFIFIVQSFLGNFYRHLAIFSGHTGKEASGRSRVSITIIMCQICYDVPIEDSVTVSATRWLDYLFNIWQLTKMKYCPIAKSCEKSLKTFTKY